MVVHKILQVEMVVLQVVVDKTQHTERQEQELQVQFREIMAASATHNKTHNMVQVVEVVREVLAQMQQLVQLSTLQVVLVWLFQ